MGIELHRQCEGEKCGGKAGGRPVRSSPVSRTQTSLALGRYGLRNLISAYP